MWLENDTAATLKNEDRIGFQGRIAHKVSPSLDGTVRYFFLTKSRMGVPEKPYSSRSRFSR